MLFMALSPPMAASIAYLFLGEALEQRSLLGMSLVISGIIMAIIGRANGFDFLKINKEDRRGYIFAFFASLGQSVGVTLTKIGIDGYNAVAGTQIRTFTAIIGFGILSLILYRGKNIKNATRNIEGLKYTSVGSVFGPFIGVTLSLVAIQRVSIGVASTLIGLTPVLILIPELLIFKKKIKPLEIAGALTAFCGTVLFFI
jgi:drug/metabolite transporter (DMT)-like permease